MSGECLQKNQRTLNVTEAAEPAAVTVLRHHARDFAAAQGGDQQLVADVALAVSEAVTNVVKYAYSTGPIGEIELAASAENGWLNLWVRDRGPSFGKGSADGLGLGLSIIARLCADLRIVQEGAGTEVQMRFALSP